MPKRPGEAVHSGRELRSAKKAITPGSWNSLPMEIRLMILEEISHQKLRGWASYAAVCKEWQAFIEQKNFHRLNLQVSCLDALEHLGIRRRGLIRYISLEIELPQYTCRSCRNFESMTSMARRNSIIKDVLLKLFDVLSTWQPTGRLILELNAYSPSDSEHWFKNYHFRSEREDNGDLVQQQTATTRWHDPKHGWTNGQQVEAPPTPAILRLFSPLCFSLPKHLPEVHAVTGLVIRRQLRRLIFPQELRFLLGKLPRLESIVYEPWRVWRNGWKAMCDRDLASVIQDGLPPHVRTVSIFEDFNDQLALALRSYMTFPELIDTSPTAGPLLARAFASKSRDFEHLSISYMIDARQFFDSCQPSYTWDHLQSLTLTSSILTQAAPLEAISTLLHNASLAASNMPRLESMILWNSQQAEACAVVYHRNKAGRQATLTWRGTWDLELSHDVVESWQKVAPDFYHLQIKNERVQGRIDSHGDAICHLHLPAGVIDAISLRRIRQEGMMQ